MKTKRLLLLIFYIVVMGIFANAQNSFDNVQNFISEEISFDYPSNWKVIDKSTSQIQQLNIVPEKGNILIMIIAYRPKVSTMDEFEQLKLQITEPRVEKISKSFSTANLTGVCAQIRDSKVPGRRMSGLYGKEETTNDSFSFVMDNKFFNLIYLKENKESSKADIAWEALIKTLQVKGKKSKKNTMMIDSGSNSVLNGKALKLPKPLFPSGIGSTTSKLKITQPVEVRVTIDENGNVISAKAISGNPSLQPSAIQAAKEAKFTPTYICGELSKVSGIIVYNFIHN